MKMDYEKYANLVCAAIEIVTLNSHDAAKWSSSMGIAAWLREFRTVSLDLGRGVGKTRFILQSAGLNDVVVPFHNARRFGEHLGRPSFAARAYSLDDIRCGRCAGLHPRWVFIDDASGFSRQELGEIYCTFGRTPGQLFILLG